MKKCILSLAVILLFLITVSDNLTGNSKEKTFGYAVLHSFKVCCKSFGYGARMVKCCEKYEWTHADQCVTPENFTGGGKEIVDSSHCK